MEKKLSQFEKRQRKEKEKTPLGQALIEAVTEAVEAKEVVPKSATIEASTLTQLGYDIFYDKDDRKHKVAVLSYNPETGAARVDEIKSIDRGVALSYDVQKQALKQLARKINKG